MGRGGLLTHSDEGEDVIHVGANVDLHKAHHHSHLLEEELDNKKKHKRRKNVKDLL